MGVRGEGISVLALRGGVGVCTGNPLKELSRGSHVRGAGWRAVPTGGVARLTTSSRHLEPPCTMSCPSLHRTAKPHPAHHPPQQQHTTLFCIAPHHSFACHRTTAPLTVTAPRPVPCPCTPHLPFPRFPSIAFYRITPTNAL